MSKTTRFVLAALIVLAVIAAVWMGGDARGALKRPKLRPRLLDRAALTWQRARRTVGACG